MTTTRALDPAANDSPHRVFQFNLLRPPTFVYRRPHLSACHQGYSRLLPRMPTARLLAFVELIARYDFALMTPLLAFARTMRTGLTRGAPSCFARQADTRLSLRTFMQIGNQPPSSWNSRPVALLVLLLALISGAGDRLTSSRSSLGTLDLYVARIRVLWRITSTDPAENFYISTPHHCAVLLNKNTFCA